jgi:mono/diheme cytochrome c family protein
MAQRRGPGAAYSRYLRGVVIGGFLLLMLGIVLAGLRPSEGGPGSPLPVAAPDASDAALVERGRALYVSSCASCHGARLEGQESWQDAPPGGPALAPPLDASGPAPQQSDATLFGITKWGGQAYAQPGYLNAMPAFGGALSDEDIRAILSYIESTWPPDVRAAQPVE